MDRLLDVSKKTVLIGTFVRYHNDIELEFFLSPYLLESHIIVLTGKMIDCPRVCFKTFHQKGKDRIAESRMLIIMEFGIDYMRIHYVILYTLKFL